MALAYAVRDRLLDRWVDTGLSYLVERSRTVCYLSAEFLLGPHLGNNLINLGAYEEVREAMHDLGLRLDDLLEQEEEPGLGNGGLGRLAACYLDSLATLQVPSIGYGVRYEFGIFDQEIRDGWQVEVTDKWVRLGNQWEIERPEITFRVKLGGHTETHRDETGRHRVRWVPEREIRGVAYDTPILGYRVPTANLLRLWTAEACESFDFQAFNVGDYYGAVDQKVLSENVSKVLYPNDEPIQGKQLRLEQQYFFVTCSLQDMIRVHLQTADGVSDLHEKYAVQLNDTASGYRGRRAHAPSGGRARDGLGACLGGDPAEPCIYEPHAASGGTGKVAGFALRSPAAPSPGDRLRDQSEVSRRRPREVPGG